MVLRTALDDARDYGSNVQAFEQGNRRQYSLSRSDLETLQRLLRGDMPLLVRANRANDISAAIRLASDYQFDLIVMGGAEAWMVADELAAAGVSVILDSLANLPESFDQLNSRLDAASILANAGVRIAIGGDGANQNHNARNITQAAGIAVANGLAWDEALVAVTLAPAQMYGVGDRIGSLEATVDYKSALAPYLGVGFGNALSHRIGFALDLGVLYTNSPAVSMSGNGMIAPTAKQAPDLEEGFSTFRWWPVLNLGFNVNFARRL